MYSQDEVRQPYLYFKCSEGVFRQATAFRFNVAVGAILGHRTTGQLRYWYSSANNFWILDRPHMVTRWADLQPFLDLTLEHDEWIDHVGMQLPNSAWRVIMITNITFYIYHIVDHPLRRGDDDNTTLKRKRGRIEGISRQGTSGNLCIFRCVAEHQGYAGKRLGTAASSVLRFCHIDMWEPPQEMPHHKQPGCRWICPGRRGDNSTGRQPENGSYHNWRGVGTGGKAKYGQWWRITLHIEENTNPLPAPQQCTAAIFGCVLLSPSRLQLCKISQNLWRSQLWGG